MRFPTHANPSRHDGTQDPDITASAESGEGIGRTGKLERTARQQKSEPVTHRNAEHRVLFVPYFRRRFGEDGLTQDALPIKLTAAGEYPVDAGQPARIAETDIRRTPGAALRRVNETRQVRALRKRLPRSPDRIVGVH